MSLSVRTANRHVRLRAVHDRVLHDVDHEGVRGPVRAVYPPGRAALRRLQEQLLLLPRDREPNEA